jgi:molecular chaperone IbpA
MPAHIHVASRRMWLCELLTSLPTIVRRSVSTGSLTCSTKNVRSDWPPYNIEKKGEDQYRITMIVAGFAPDEIELVQHEATLLVTGQKSQQPELLHQGIPLSFKQSFNLADHVKVAGANVEHGLLMIDLVREVPEQLKPRRIDIGARAETKAAKPESQPKQIDTGAQKAA